MFHPSHFKISFIFENLRFRQVFFGGEKLEVKWRANLSYFWEHQNPHPSQKTVPTYGLKDTPDNFGPQASIAEADLHSLIFVDLYAWYRFCKMKF